MNSVFAQYEELPSPQFAVINVSLRLRFITANFGLDNSSYRAQPHSIIVKYLLLNQNLNGNEYEYDFLAPGRTRSNLVLVLVVAAKTPY